MKYGIFENNQEKADAKQSLPELEKHPGWKFITRTLDVNIEYLTDKLKTRKDFDNLEQVYALQQRIDDFQNLKELPATIVQATQDPAPEEDDSIY